MAVLAYLELDKVNVTVFLVRCCCRFLTSSTCVRVKLVKPSWRVCIHTSDQMRPSSLLEIPSLTLGTLALGPCVRFTLHPVSLRQPFCNFLTCLSDMPPATKRSFLLFVLGCPHLPPGGLCALTPPLEVKSETNYSRQEHCGKSWKAVISACHLMGFDRCSVIGNMMDGIDDREACFQEEGAGTIQAVGRTFYEQWLVSFKRLCRILREWGRSLYEALSIISSSTSADHVLTSRIALRRGLQLL